ncbi:unnamed protein product [Choristocarpus tenellus]
MGTLEGIEDSHILYGKPVCRAQVCGVVVHVKLGSTKKGSYVKYLLDDGTGFLACTHYEQDLQGVKREAHTERHNLGDLLVVQGKLKRFKGAREIMIVTARRVTDPNEEVLHWVRAMELTKTVYTLPFDWAAYVDKQRVLDANHVHTPHCACGALYVKALGYCRCVANPMCCDPDFVFRDAMLSHLCALEEILPPGIQLHFQFARDVRDEPSLQETARQVVAASSVGGGWDRKGLPIPAKDSTVSEGGGGSTLGNLVSAREGKLTTKATLQPKVLELFRATMYRLVKDGVVHLLDREEDIYVLMSVGRVLQPSVEHLCREKGLQLTQENEIIKVLQSTAFYHHLPGLRIRACLNSMKSEEVAKSEGDG